MPPGSRTIAEIFVAVKPDTTNTGRDMERQLKDDPRIRRAGENAGKSFGGGFTRATKALIAGAAGVLVSQRVISGIRETVTAASDLSETVSKSRNVFGPAAATVAKFSTSSAKSFGISQQAALAATAQFGDMFIQLGFTQKQSAKTSTTLLKTAADLGSFHNVDPTDVLQRIQAAFRGEYDSLQSLIPNINAARVEQEALALTHKKSAKDLTASEKATATLAIIQRDGRNAANDFAETSGGLANQQRILAAQTDDLKSKIGTALLPVLTAGARVLNDQYLPPIAAFAQKHGPAFGKRLAEIAEEKGPKFAKFIKDVAIGFKAVFDLMVRGDFTAQFRETFGVQEDAPIVDFLFRVREGFIRAKDAVGPFFKSLSQGDTSQTTAAFSSLADSAEKLTPVVQDFIHAMPGFSETLNVSATAVSFLADHTDTLRKLMPFLAAGFIAVKVAQAAANFAAVLSLPTKIAEVVVNRQLIKSNRELIAARAGNTGAMIVETVVTSASTTAKGAGAAMTLRQRAASMASAAAARAVAAATVAWTGVQWLLNAAMTANPIGIVIALVAALVLGIIIAYNKSETFRKIVHAMWNALKDGAISAVGIVLTVVDKYLGGMQAILSVMGKMPGPLGKPFREMADKVQGARDKVQGLKERIDGLRPKTVPVDVIIRGTDVTALPINAQQRFGFNRLAAAFGGWIPGQRTGDRSDNVPAMLTAGEFVIQRPTARKLERHSPGFLDALNAGRVDIAGDKGFMRVAFDRAVRFAAGGSVQAVKSFIRGTDPLPYIWGGAGPGGYDCSGLVGAVYGLLTGRGGGRGQRYFTTDTVGTGQGWRPGLGSFSLGVTPGRGHMAGQLGDLRFEARSTAAGILIGSAATPVTSFARKFYLPSVPGAFGSDPGLTKAQISSTIRSIRPQITRAILRELGVTADTGGYLMPGWNPPTLNMTGGRERVLNRSETDAYEGGGIKHEHHWHVSGIAPFTMRDAVEAFERQAIMHGL